MRRVRQRMLPALWTLRRAGWQGALAMAARHADTLTCCHSVVSLDAVALRRGVTPTLRVRREAFNSLATNMVGHGYCWVVGSDV